MTVASQLGLPLQPPPAQPQAAQWEWGRAAWETTGDGDWLWKVRDPRDPERSIYCGPSEADAEAIAAWAHKRYGGAA